MDRRRKEIATMVKVAGLKLESVRTTGGNHLEVRVKAKDGRDTRMFFSSTPSDHRSELNKKSMLKRFASGIPGKVG